MTKGRSKCSSVPLLPCKFSGDAPSKKIPRPIFANILIHPVGVHSNIPSLFIFLTVTVCVHAAPPVNTPVFKYER